MVSPWSTSARRLTAGVQLQSWRRLFFSPSVRKEHRTGFLPGGEASGTRSLSYLRATSAMWPRCKQGLCLFLAQDDVLVRYVDDVLLTAPGQQGALVCMPEGRE